MNMATAFCDMGFGLSFCLKKKSLFVIIDWMHVCT